jgi:hypothetical protein
MPHAYTEDQLVEQPAMGVCSRSLAGQWCARSKTSAGRTIPQRRDCRVCCRGKWRWRRGLITSLENKLYEWIL